MFKVDIKKAEKKWAAVLDVLGVTPQKSREALSVYCEMTNNNIVDNLLPISLKIASKLVELDRIIENGNLELSDTPVEQHMFKVIIAKDYYEQPGINLIQQYESILIKTLVEYLNIKLKGATKFKVFSLCKKLYIDVDSNGNKTMNLLSDYKIIGSREEKIKRILN